MKQHLKGELILAFVTLCWGCSYILIDVCLEELETFGLNALRFSAAFLVTLLFILPTIKTLTKTTIKFAFFTAVSLFFAYIGATLGVQYTSLSNAGFMCCISCIFTPIIVYFVYRRRPNKKFVFVLLLCLAGAALLTLKDGFHMAPGDIFSLMCSVGYAVDLVITEAAVKKPDVNPLHLGVFQLGFVAVFFIILSRFMGQSMIAHQGKTWIAVMVLATLCTGVAFVCQAISQQYTTASRAGIIITLEPVFSAIVAFIFAGEILMFRSYVGAGLMLASLFIMEIDFKTLFKGRRK